MATKRKRWVVFILLLIFLAYLIPFTLLRDVDAWFGSFLFWCVYALAMIVINARIAADWRDEE
ncbi:hypothetical protein BSNK01_09780 [Bacillaceae bacterium]